MRERMRRGGKGGVAWLVLERVVRENVSLSPPSFSLLACEQCPGARIARRRSPPRPPLPLRLLHDLRQPLHHVLVLGVNILRLPRICRQIVKLPHPITRPRL